MITNKQAKQFNNIMKIKNAKYTISVAKKTLETITKEKKETFPKNEYINLKKYLCNNTDIIVKDFISKSGKEMYILKNGTRQLLIEKTDVEYSIIDTKSKEIYPKIGYEALNF